MKTKKFDMFVLSKRNRNPSLRPGIVRSMKEKGFLSVHAIVCKQLKNGKLEILSGQHRYIAASHLGIELWYVVTTDEFDPATDSEQTRPWKPRDYADVNANCGNEHYQELIEFCDANGVGVCAARTLFSGGIGSQGVGNQFKKGIFKIRDRETPKIVMALYRQLSTICPKLSQSRLIAVLINISRMPDFSLEEWQKRIKRNASQVRRCTSQDEYYDMMENVYNFRYPDHEKKSIAFAAKRAH